MGELDLQKTLMSTTFKYLKLLSDIAVTHHRFVEFGPPEDQVVQPETLPHYKLLKAQLSQVDKKSWLSDATAEFQDQAEALRKTGSEGTPFGIQVEDLLLAARRGIEEFQTCYIEPVRQDLGRSTYDLDVFV